VQGPGRAILDKALQGLGDNQLRVGWFKTSRYPDGTYAAYIAAIMEFGYAPKNIPPRLGMRALTQQKETEWAGWAEFMARNVMNGASVESQLEGLGGKVRGDIAKRISDVQEPPLAESTLRERASRLGIKRSELSGTGAKPLVEPVMKNGGAGGYMLATVQWLITKTGSGDNP